jgi:hypothetical protein
MNEEMISRYGEVKSIRYLAGSIDDLKDVVETVKQMISRNCDKGDKDELMLAIAVDAIPLQHSLSSFIISLSVPELVLKSKYHHPNIV